MEDTTTQQIAASELQPPPQQRVRTFLLGYGHRRRRPLLSSLVLYEKMERDYAIALALAILKAPVIASRWTIVVEQSEELLADPADVDEEQETPAQDTTFVSDTPSIQVGLQSPNSTTQQINNSTSDKIAAALDLMLRPLWRSTVKHMLTAISRKAAPFEKLFEMRTINGKTVTWLKKLKPVQLRDAELLAIEKTLPDGQVEVSFGGMRVQQRIPPDVGTSQPEPSQPVDVPWWKTFWFALDADDGELVGPSRLENVKRSWWDKNDEDGALDVETMWFRKYVYEGIEVSYPEGTTQRVGGGTEDNADIAMRIGQNILAGGVAAIPVAEGADPEKNPWAIKRAGEQKKSDEVSKWIDDRLDHRIFRGLYVAPMVAGGSQGDTGTFALASVQFDVFLQTVEDILQQVVDWISRYVLKQIVEWNWGAGWTVRIEPKPLANEAKELLSKIIQAIFTGQASSKVLSMLDLESLLEQAGLPLAEDVSDRAAAVQGELAQSPITPPMSVVSGQSSVVGNGQPSNGSRLVRQSADRSADELIDESSAAAVSFWDTIRSDLKKKRIEAAIGTN